MKFTGKGKRFIELKGDQVLIDNEKTWYNKISVTTAAKFNISEIKAIEIFEGAFMVGPNPYIEFVVSGALNKKDFLEEVLGIETYVNYPYIVYIKEKQLVEAKELRDKILLMIKDLKSSEEILKSANSNSHENDIPSKIKKLSDLFNEGILTEDEFNNKKNDLLSKM